MWRRVHGRKLNDFVWHEKAVRAKRGYEMEGRQSGSKEKARCERAEAFGVIEA